MIFLKKSLYIVGIPIGNIFDFSQRAIFVLKNVNIIATEDSRKTGFLLKFLNIRTKLISLRICNEFFLSQILIDKIKSGISIAFVSDSGTPLISDPGFFLLQSAYKNRIRVIPIPGISSFLTALSISSLFVDHFIFEGFLPKNRVYKEIFFKQFLYEKRSVIFFESARRLLDTLVIMKNVFIYSRKIFICKDLTKRFEFFLHFDFCDLDAIVKCNYTFFDKGEFVLLLGGVHVDVSSSLDVFSTFINVFIKRERSFECIFIVVILSKNVFYSYIF